MLTIKLTYPAYFIYGSSCVYLIASVTRNVHRHTPRRPPARSWLYFSVLHVYLTVVCLSPVHQKPPGRSLYRLSLSSFPLALGERTIQAQDSGRPTVPGFPVQTYPPHLTHYCRLSPDQRYPKRTPACAFHPAPFTDVTVSVATNPSLPAVQAAPTLWRHPCSRAIPVPHANPVCISYTCLLSPFRPAPFLQLAKRVLSHGSHTLFRLHLSPALPSLARSLTSSGLLQSHLREALRFHGEVAACPPPPHPSLLPCPLQPGLVCPHGTDRH